MTRFASAALAACSVLALALAASAEAAPAAKVRARAPTASVAWPQAHSDLKADPALRFGRLPNGMRYVLMHNATPQKQTAIRLRIGSGSVEERADQQGLAHFLEHLAFKGSTHVPEDEMLRILERKGLAFGPDTNAFTSWTETVYQLDLPNSDDDTLDTGLMLMRETGSELSLTPRAIDRERGVILSEERQRDTPNYEVAKHAIRFQLKGQLASERFPIGKVEVIKGATPELIRQFYEANYRPENATLIVVGDVDVDKLEAKIKSRFSSWTGKGAAAPKPRLGPPIRRGAETAYLIQPGAQLTVQVAWTQPYDDGADTVAHRTRDIVQDLGLQVINRRLDRLARGPNPPFLAARTGSQNTLHSAKIASLQVTAPPKAWKSALEAAETVRRQAVQFGVTDSELQREIAEQRTTYQNAAAGAATRRTPALADEIVNAVEEDNVATAPAEELRVFEQAVKGLTAEKVNAALRQTFRENGPLLFVATPEPIEGGEAAVKTAFASIEAKPVQAPAAQAAVTWPYASFGPAGQVAERREVSDLGVTFVRFANGVRLTVKPTTFRKDQIEVSLRVGEGLLALPKDRPSVNWAASALPAGGLGKLSYEDLQQVLADHIFGVSAGITANALQLSGATRPADLDVQMQVLAAYLSDPGFRPEAFQRVKQAVTVALPQLAATPGGVLQRDLSGLLHPGDRRFGFPSPQEIAAAQPDDLKALLAPTLAKAPVEVVVVGDTTVDKAIAAVARTLGALPPRAPEAPPSPDALKVSFPGPALVERTHTGRADQSIAFTAWPTSDLFSNVHRARVLQLLDNVLELRLIDEIRTNEGATYSPAVQEESSDVFPGYGYLFAYVETPPAKDDAFFANVSKIAADLRTKEVTADELDRARNPAIEQVLKARETNEYWRARLSGAQTDPRRLELVRTGIPDLKSVTPAEIKATAQQYLTDERAWKMVVRPAAKP